MLDPNQINQKKFKSINNKIQKRINKAEVGGASGHFSYNAQVSESKAKGHCESFWWFDNQESGALFEIIT